MDRFAISIFPVAKLDERRAWCASAEWGERPDDDRAFLKRLGVKREDIFHQATPAGDLMVLVHEGVAQDEMAEKLGDMMENPQSEHERYIATHVIPEIHGVDPSAGPPPETESVAHIEVN